MRKICCFRSPGGNRLGSITPTTTLLRFMHRSQLMMANWATCIGSWERFRIVDAGSGNVGIISLDNNKYVSMNNNRAEKALQASRANGIGSWETFQWVDLGNRKFALKIANHQQVRHQRPQRPGHPQSGVGGCYLRLGAVRVGANSIIGIRAKPSMLPRQRC